MMTEQYLEGMVVHIDEGGQLSHKNALELLNEVLRMKKAFRSLKNIDYNKSLFEFEGKLYHIRDLAKLLGD